MVKLDHVMLRVKSVKLNPLLTNHFRTSALFSLSLMIRGAHIVYKYSCEYSSTTTHVSASPHHLPQTETPLDPVEVVSSRS